MGMAMVKDKELFSLLEQHGPALNFLGKKNKLGCYLPPALALLDRSFLASLDARQLSNGAAEIMKMAVLHTDKLYHGEAVAVDMSFCTVLAYVRGQITAEYRDRLLPHCAVSACPS